MIHLPAEHDEHEHTGDSPVEHDEHEHTERDLTAEHDDHEYTGDSPVNMMTTGTQETHLLNMINMSTQKETYLLSMMTISRQEAPSTTALRKKLIWRERDRLPDIRYKAL